MTIVTETSIRRRSSSHERRLPVRVCFLIDELAKAGTETQLLALIRHLDRARVEPFLCLLRGKSSLSRSLEPQDCPVVRLGVGSLHGPRALLAGWKLGRFLRRNRIDILQVYFPDSTYLGVPVGRLAGVPVVVRTRNNIGHWLTPWHRFLGRVLNPLTHFTIANCEAAKEALVQAEGTSPNRVVVLENGVDLQRFISVPPLAETSLWRFGVVANLRPVKGLDVLVAAAARVVKDYPQATFAVAGEGSEREALLRQASELGLSNRFLLHGSVTDIPSFLGSIDIAVLSSRAEGMSNAVMEYMAAGRAIIATDVGANRRLLTHGVHGLLAPPGDVTALAGAMAELLADPERARRLGAAARRRAREEFSREAMGRRFEDFYEGLLC
jgi:glycosyltransferase involved in cell wall biosynthesis